MRRIKKDDDFFNDFNIFSADELNQMDFFLSNLRFFEKGILNRASGETSEKCAKLNPNIENEPGNCFFLIVPKSERIPEKISRRAA